MFLVAFNDLTRISGVYSINCMDLLVAIQKLLLLLGFSSMLKCVTSYYLLTLLLTSDRALCVPGGDGVVPALLGAALLGGGRRVGRLRSKRLFAIVTIM